MLSHTLALEHPSEDSHRRVPALQLHAQHMHELNACDMSKNFTGDLALTETGAISQSTLFGEDSQHTGRTRHLFVKTSVVPRLSLEALEEAGPGSGDRTAQQGSAAGIQDTGELPLSCTPLLCHLKLPSGGSGEVCFMTLNA